MFKAPIKVLHPLLTATQESNYTGTESSGAFPYQGIILAHSNEAEWQQFKSNKNNEAFLDRKSVVSGKSVSVRVDLGGRRIIQQKTQISLAHSTAVEKQKKKT